MWEIVSVIVGVVSIIIMLYIYWQSKKGKEEQKLVLIEESKKEPDEVEEVVVKPDIKEKVLVKSRYLTVYPGDHEKLSYRLKKGHRLKGLAKEVDRQDFNFYIVDEDNYARYCNGDMFTTIFNRDKVNTVAINVLIPYNEKWYLIFEGYRKQYERRVRVTDLIDICG